MPLDFDQNQMIVSTLAAQAFIMFVNSKVFNWVIAKDEPSRNVIIQTVHKGESPLRTQKFITFARHCQLQKITSSGKNC